jgi:hypothetical protein
MLERQGIEKSRLNLLPRPIVKSSENQPPLEWLNLKDNSALDFLT